jgi:hypothetical protein
MSKELEPTERADRMNQVMELFLRGENATEIARKIGFRRVEVIEYIEDWKRVAQSNDQLQTMAKEAVLGSTQHYNSLIRELWAVVEECNHGGDARTKTTALKTIAELEEKRINFLQKAGLLDESDLGDKIAEMEEKADAIKALLQGVATAHPATRAMIMQGLSKIFNQPIGVVIPE